MKVLILAVVLLVAAPVWGQSSKAGDNAANRASVMSSLN